MEDRVLRRYLPGMHAPERSRPAKALASLRCHGCAQGRQRPCVRWDVHSPTSARGVCRNFLCATVHTLCMGKRARRSARAWGLDAWLLRNRNLCSTKAASKPFREMHLVGKGCNTCMMTEGKARCCVSDGMNYHASDQTSACLYDPSRDLIGGGNVNREDSSPDRSSVLIQLSCCTLDGQRQHRYLTLIVLIEP